MPTQLVRQLKKEGYANAERGLYLFSASGRPGDRPLGKNYFRCHFNLLRDKLGLSPDYKLYSFKYTGGVALVNNTGTVDECLIGILLFAANLVYVAGQCGNDSGGFCSGKFHFLQDG